jgi:hypothetical protein
VDAVLRVDLQPEFRGALIARHELVNA